MNSARHQWLIQEFPKDANPLWALTQYFPTKKQKIKQKKKKKKTTQLGKKSVTGGIPKAL